MASKTLKRNNKNVFTDSGKVLFKYLEKNIPKTKLSPRDKSCDRPSPSPRLKSFPAEKIRRINGNVLLQPSVSQNAVIIRSHSKKNIGHGDAINSPKQIHITPNYQFKNASKSQQNMTFFYPIENTNQSEGILSSQKAVTPLVQTHRPFVPNSSHGPTTQDCSPIKQSTPRPIVSHLPTHQEKIPKSLNSEQDTCKTEDQEIVTREQNRDHESFQINSETFESDYEKQPVGGRIAIGYRQSCSEQMNTNLQKEMPQKEIRSKGLIQQQLSPSPPVIHGRDLLHPNNLADKSPTVSGTESVKHPNDQQVNQQQYHSTCRQQMQQNAVLHQQQMAMNQMQQRAFYDFSNQKNQHFNPGMTSPQDVSINQGRCHQNVNHPKTRTQLGSFSIDLVNPQLNQFQAKERTKCQESVPSGQYPLNNQDRLRANQNMQSTTQQQLKTQDLQQSHHIENKVYYFTPQMLKDQELLITIMQQQQFPEDVMQRQFQLLLNEQKKQLVYLDGLTQKEEKVIEKTRNNVCKKNNKTDVDEKPEWMAHITPPRITYCELEKMKECSGPDVQQLQHHQNRYDKQYQHPQQYQHHQPYQNHQQYQHHQQYQQDQIHQQQYQPQVHCEQHRQFQAQNQQLQGQNQQFQGQNQQFQGQNQQFQGQNQQLQGQNQQLQGQNQQLQVQNQYPQVQHQQYHQFQVHCKHYQHFQVQNQRFQGQSQQLQGQNQQLQGQNQQFQGQNQQFQGQSQQLQRQNQYHQVQHQQYHQPQVHCEHYQHLQVQNGDTRHQYPQVQHQQSKVHQYPQVQHQQLMVHEYPQVYHQHPEVQHQQSLISHQHPHGQQQQSCVQDQQSLIPYQHSYGQQENSQIQHPYYHQHQSCQNYQHQHQMTDLMNQNSLQNPSVHCQFNHNSPTENKISTTTEASSLLQLRFYKDIVKPQKRNNGLQDPDTIKEALEALKNAEAKKGLEYLANLNKMEPVVKLNGTQEPGEIPEHFLQKPPSECFQVSKHVSANGLENQRNPNNPLPPVKIEHLDNQLTEYPRSKKPSYVCNNTYVAEKENGNVDPNYQQYQYLQNQVPPTNWSRVCNPGIIHPHYFDNGHVKESENQPNMRSHFVQYGDVMTEPSEIQEPRIIGGLTYLARKPNSIPASHISA